MLVTENELKKIIVSETRNEIKKILDENSISRLFSHWGTYINNPGGAVKEKDRFIQYAKENPKDSKWLYDNWINKFPAYADQVRETFGFLFNDGNIQPEPAKEDESEWANDAHQAFIDIKPFGTHGWVPGAKKAGWSDEKINHYKGIFNAYYKGKKQPTQPSQPAQPTQPEQAVQPEQPAQPLVQNEPEQPAQEAPQTGIEANQQMHQAFKAANDDYKNDMVAAMGNKKAADAQAKALRRQARTDLKNARRKANFDKNAAKDMARNKRSYDRQQMGKRVYNHDRADKYAATLQNQQMEEEKLRSMIKSMVKESLNRIKNNK